MNNTKQKITYTCQNCSYQAVQWIGQCPECKEWNSLVEQISAKDSGKTKKRSSSDELPKLISEVKLEQHQRDTSGISEFDRVLGGGIIKGSLILIGGEPGIGKSTLLTKLVGNLSRLNPAQNLLYISGEESTGQIADRCHRLGVSGENFYVFNETNWERIVTQLKKIKPQYIVLDSIQTTTSSNLTSPPGTVSQIREVTYELMNYAKGLNITCFVIGHITKDGAIAGPKILEHMVDTVIYFEGDQFGHYRLLRVTKNRFGNTNEVGVFEMGENGLVEITNPSKYFLDEELQGAYRRSLSCILEGTRALFVEIQALVIENKFGNGRRTTQGLDLNRLSTLVAVIEKYFSIPISNYDIYLNVVGGIKLIARDSDLSIIASLISSYKSSPLENSVVFIGEVGLSGEVRSVPHISQRLKEMAQLQYKKVITSNKVAKEFKDKFPIEIIGIKNANELEELL